MISVQITLEDGKTPGRTVNGTINILPFFHRGCRIVRGSPSNRNVPPEWEEYYSDATPAQPKGKAGRPKKEKTT